MDEIDLLIERLDQARQALQVILDMTEASLDIYPSWKQKELLAHLAGWDEAAIASIQAYLAGNAPVIPAGAGINAYNAESVARRVPLSLEQVRQECLQRREQLKALILQMETKKLFAPLVLPWKGTGTVAQIVEIYAEHELEHAEELRTILETSDRPYS
jgi:hypothetical protein